MSEVFSDAVVTYLGYGTASAPQSTAILLDPLVRRKLDQVLSFANSLRPDWTSLDLETSGDWAKGMIAAEFPYLTQEALDALAWACTYGWK